MTPERWQQITGIFQAALERPTDERALFVKERCAGDEELRREVQDMLSSHEQASRFIEEPAMNVAARLTPNGASLVGKLIAHYQVLSLVGTGGMGEVYLAEDTRLGRRVALKLLPEDLAKNEKRVMRFQQEARAASNLNHPNILTIHEIGQFDSRHFIATEFIDGETLRQRLHKERMELGAVLHVATEIASALAAAHAAGIIHRDIKPENVMIRRDRIVKVLDFGLAKLTESDGGKVDTQLPTKLLVNTEPGMVMGTANYMSPEQARGLEVDARTDIWSLGAVLYEMVTGHVPFEGQTPTDVLSLILQKQPPPLARYAADVPEELDRIVTKSLVKDRDDRYQTVKDLLIDLQRLRRKLDLKAEMESTIPPHDPADPSVTVNQKHTTVAELPQSTGTPAHTASSAEYIVTEVKRHKWGVLMGLAAIIIAAVAIYVYNSRAGRQIHSLAVLPMVNGTGDPNSEYLSDGITESLIDSLSQLPNLQVKSLNSVLRYKGRDVDAQTVGRELGVEAVVTGRMMQRGDGLVVSVEMVNVNDNNRLWGGRYDRKLSDLVAVQNEISREVLEKLKLRLTGEQEKRATNRYTENTEAYQLYLRGRYHWNRRAIEDLWKGQENFQRAIELDPNFALAWAGLADCYVTMVLGGPFAPNSRSPMSLGEVRTKWGPAARRAVELGPDLAEAHATLGKGLEWLDWDLAGAEREYKRALELNPDEVTAHHRYGVFLIVNGQTDEGLKELKRALELDPASLPINADLGIYYCSALRDPDRGIAQLKKTIELTPDWPRPHNMLSSCYAQKGMWKEALQEFQMMGAPGAFLNARMYAAAGKREEALKIVAEMKEREKQQRVSPMGLANVYAALGDKDQAFEWLEKAYRERAPQLRGIKIGPTWDPLRSDPRFADLLKRIGLPP
jgi:serine/threonine protein kinase/tetratricopeptide (TPR) repeat protein